ncbi:MAG: hypothetical protein M3Q36_00930 [bacterium]|nr:hypothetical protein [bacterium]
MTNQNTAERPTKITKKTLGFWQDFWRRQTIWAVRTKFWQKLGLGLLASVILLIGSMYGIAQWYIRKNSDRPLVIGATFIPSYARKYGLDPKETLTAMVDDIGFKQIRLVSYWSDIEKEQGTYDFSELDWQMKLAEDKGVRVNLSLGLRQPRWPECHMPNWAQSLKGTDWYQPLETFIAKTVERYRDSPALQSYQLENEYFLKGFGICTDMSRDRLVSEFNRVKSLDSKTPLIVTLSNNAIGMPVGEPTPDQWGVSIYKRVWDAKLTKRYFEYPIPAWYYAFRAGFIETVRGKSMIVHELQAEAWTPPQYGDTVNAPIQEQYKSFSPDMLKERIEYGRATGMKSIDLWGPEWWYWLKTKQNAPEIWDNAQAEIQRISEENQ